MNKGVAATLLVFLLLAGCGGGSGGSNSSTNVSGTTNTGTVTPPAQPTNTAPVANAGVQQNVSVGATVTLDGSASTDANNDPLTYAWVLTSKPTNSTASLSSLTSPKPTFIADTAGDYVFTLTVNDGKVSSTPSTITVKAAVANVAPVANAGAAQNALTGTIVTLDGSGSSDANGDVLSYSWTLTGKPTGSAAALSGTSTVKTTFVPDVAGTYTASLTVNDGTVNSAPVTTTITATMANVAPVANAGSASRVVNGATVTLDGTHSSDANGDQLSYSWTLTSKPAGSQAVLSASNTATPSLITDVNGVYVASLSVNDGKLTSSTVTTTITVVPRIAAAMGISFSDTFVFCGMAGTINTVSSSGVSSWTINNCQVYGSAGSNLAVRIQNNGNTPIKLTQIDVQSSIFVNSYPIGASSQMINPQSSVDFNVPLWLSMEITNATATFKIEGEPDLVVGLKGSVTLP